VAQTEVRREYKSDVDENGLGMEDMGKTEELVKQICKFIFVH
jgi:hypothetical protein